MSARRKPSASRSIGYVIEGEFDEPAAEAILRRAESQGVVVRGQWDTGREHMMWFNGPPGASMRALRDELRALVRP